MQKIQFGSCPSAYNSALVYIEPRGFTALRKEPQYRQKYGMVAQGQAADWVRYVLRFTELSLS